LKGSAARANFTVPGIKARYRKYMLFYLEILKEYI